MSGMKVTKRTLLSRNRVCGPATPPPIRPGYTQRACGTALGQPDRQGLLQVDVPGRAFDGHSAARSTPLTPLADAVSVKRHASCCYQIGRQSRSSRFLLLSKPEPVVFRDG